MRITPVTRLSVSGLALLAKIAAILAHINVKTIHNTNTGMSGMPPIAKWETAPVNAVKVIMKTLVPTAVFNSYPSTEVRMSNIIIPPPAPTKPQIKPISMPQARDWIARFFAGTSDIDSLVAMTGFRINFTPRKKVMMTEKFPIVVDGRRLAM